MEYQGFLLKISNRFTRIVAGKIDDMISSTLQDLAELFDAERGYVILFSNDGSRVDNTYEWCAEGIQLSAHILRDKLLDLFPWTLEKIQCSETVYISSVNDLPLEAQWEHGRLHLKGTQSLCLVPLTFEDNLLGFLGLDSTTMKMVWSEERVTILDIVAQMVANGLQRRKYAEALVQSENYYRTIFENTGAATIIIGEDMSISMANQEWERILG